MDVSDNYNLRAGRKYWYKPSASKQWVRSTCRRDQGQLLSNKPSEEELGLWDRQEAIGMNYTSSFNIAIPRSIKSWNADNLFTDILNNSDQFISFKQNEAYSFRVSILLLRKPPVSIPFIIVKCSCCVTLRPSKILVSFPSSLNSIDLRS